MSPTKQNHPQTDGEYRVSHWASSLIFMFTLVSPKVGEPILIFINYGNSGAVRELEGDQEITEFDPLIWRVVKTDACPKEHHTFLIFKNNESEFGSFLPKMQ